VIEEGKPGEFPNRALRETVISTEINRACEERSPWDTLHPGRDWAHRDPKMRDARPKERIKEDIAKHFGAHPPFKTMDQILKVFLEEIRAAS
jgi:hypothetical protein